MFTTAKPPASGAQSDPWSERARAALRHQLTRDTPLTREAIEHLVRYAEFAPIPRGGEVCASDTHTRNVRFVMSGVTKLVCRIAGGRDQVARFHAPHRFLCLPPIAATQGYRAVIVAHEDVDVALLRYQDFGRALGVLGDRAAKVHSWGFRSRVLSVCDVAALLRLDLVERVLHALRHLATELRDPTHRGPGIAVATSIGRDDIADLSGNSRPAVCRVMARLEAAGLVLPSSPSSVVVAEVVLKSEPRQLAALVKTKTKGGLP